MDHCLETAPYPNVALAFCGALALQALLAGRKVRDEADNRTNIYLLALAFSAGGEGLATETEYKNPARSWDAGIAGRQICVR
jgi:hypothetical protein